MKETVLSIIRHLLTAAGAAAVAKGYISDSASAEIIGLLVALAGAVWGPLDEFIAARRAKLTAPAVVPVPSTVA